MSDIELDYGYLTQKSLRRVIVDVLQITADLQQAPGDHHFYIEFVTQAPGVVMPESLLAAYPERMTIVLQHQFENLRVDEESFSVSLWFKGKQADMTVPFEAITSFADPSVQFVLRFDATPETDEDGAAAEEAPADASEPSSSDSDADNHSSDDREGADVVSLDSFRKK
ncbi:MAG: ClpXP protease specificity-enhancing factor SspB [Planctomycetota bacterium]